MEFAIVVPLLLLLLMAIIGYGLAFYRSLTVTYADRSAIRIGVVDATPCQIYGDILYLMPGTYPTVNFTFPSGPCTISSSSYSTGNDTCNSTDAVYTAGKFLTVQIVNPVTSPIYLPGLGTNYTLSESTTMLIEGSDGVSVTYPQPSSWATNGTPSWCTY